MVNPSSQNRKESAFVGAQKQCEQFVAALFQPSDLIEVRAIAPTGRVVRLWFEARDITSNVHRLARLNQEGFNIYFGVNPRTSQDGTKSGVALCRSVWADLDRVSVDDALSLCRLLPEPSLVINSGHGAHLYWLLDSPVNVSRKEDRDLFEGKLKAFYQEIDSDSTQDVSRLLRMPGFLNLKDAPVLCELIRSAPGLTYPISTFERWCLPEAADDSKAISSSSSRDGIVTTHIAETHDLKRIRGLVAALDKEVEDRSRRDFWVVSRLRELGLTSDEIKTLVTGHSKFTTDAYVKRTLENAFRAVR